MDPLELPKWRRDDWNSGLFSVEEIKVHLPALGGRNLRLLATDMENTEEQSMKLHDWEGTIQQIIEDSNHEPKESGKSRVLMEWRAKLAQQPHLLQPFQIDEIVREVRKLLTRAIPQSSIGPPHAAFFASPVSSPSSIAR